MLKLLIPALILMGLVFFGLAIGILFSKRKKFPESSVSKNPELRKLNLQCAKHEEYKACGLSSCCGGKVHSEIAKMKRKDKSSSNNQDAK